MTPASDFNSYLPVYNDIPDEWQSARQILIERLRRISDAINSKDYALYVDNETLTGQLWLPRAQNDFRDGFRKVIDISPLPDFGAVSPYLVPHLITFTENTCITRMFGAATDPGATTITKGISLPYIEMPGGSHIGIEIDDTNIIITGDGATDYSAYICAYIVVEWTDEV